MFIQTTHTNKVYQFNSGWISKCHPRFLGQQCHATIWKDSKFLKQFLFMGTDPKFCDKFRFLSFVVALRPLSFRFFFLSSCFQSM